LDLQIKSQKYFRFSKMDKNKCPKKCPGKVLEGSRRGWDPRNSK
jgi:hypothetical protein